MKLPDLKNDALKNKVILVTGAGDGIGKQAAIHYAKLGATVILLGKTQFKLEQVFDEIVLNKNPEPIILTVDLSATQQDYFNDLADSIEQELGRLDGILHSAGQLGTIQPTVNIAEKEFDEVMQVNLRSQFFLTQALIPLLLKSENSSVIFTSSSVAQKAKAYWGSYCISKIASDGMMRLFADEYENSNVRFNAINPGATRTNLRAKAYPAEAPESLKSPQDIMPIYEYLMSDISCDSNGNIYIAQPKKSQPQKSEHHIIHV